MRRIKPLHLFWKRIALFNMFTKNIHVSLFSINLCLENGPGKSVFENVFVKYTKYGGSNTNTNTNTWFEIWSNTNTNTNTPYLYLYLYLQIQIRIWPQPCGPCMGYLWFLVKHWGNILVFFYHLIDSNGKKDSYRLILSVTKSGQWRCSLWRLSQTLPTEQSLHKTQRATQVGLMLAQCQDNSTNIGPTYIAVWATM